MRLSIFCDAAAFFFLAMMVSVDFQGNRVPIRTSNFIGPIGPYVWGQGSSYNPSSANQCRRACPVAEIGRLSRWVLTRLVTVHSVPQYGVKQNETRPRRTDPHAIRRGHDENAAAEGREEPGAICQCPKKNT